MRISFPTSVKLIRSKGYDVLDIKEANITGITDIEVIQRAKNEGRILLALDMHFSNIFLFPPSQCPGIIVIRVKPAVPVKVDSIVSRFLESLKPQEVSGALTILSNKGIRTYRDAL